jgi:hypothetical protein
MTLTLHADNTTAQSIIVTNSTEHATTTSHYLSTAEYTTTAHDETTTATQETSTLSFKKTTIDAISETATTTELSPSTASTKHQPVLLHSSVNVTTASSDIDESGDSANPADEIYMKCCHSNQNIPSGCYKYCNYWSINNSTVSNLEILLKQT